MLEYSWDWSAAVDGLPLLIEGLAVSFAVALTVMIVSLPVSLIVAGARFSTIAPIRFSAYAYTELLRTLPLLVLLTWFFFVPGVTFGVNLEPFVIAVVAFVLTTSAFLSEVVRGSIQSIDPGQREAAMAAGMTSWQTTRRVVLPQALRRALPLIGAIWISLLKDTSLVSVVAVHDLMFEARVLAVTVYRPIEVLTLAAVIYFVVTYPQGRFLEWVFQRVRVSE